MAKVKYIQIHAPAEAMGLKTTVVASKNYELEESEHGIVCFSKSSGKKIVVPYGNIKCYELEGVAPAPKEKK
jgi:hypothetical protein